MADDTKVNNEVDKAPELRTLKSEKIKGVDVMVNRAIERILAADNPAAAKNTAAQAPPVPKEEKVSDSVKSKPRKRTKPNNTQPADALPIKKNQPKKAAPKGAAEQEAQQHKRKPHKTKKVVFIPNSEDEQVSSSQVFIANPLAVSQQKYRQVNNTKKPSSRDYKLRVIPLGGLGEVGKNMTVIQYGEEILVVDGGLSFPDDGMYGIDLVIPDYSYLVENRNHVRAFCLTHGHEDHIGALPYVLKDIQAPVYGSTLTLGLLKGKLNENRVKADLREVKAREEVEIGPFKVEFFRLTHSIPDSMGMAIHTPVGTIMVVSDFKMDMSPIDGQFMDFGRISALGEKGVLLLLSDSTNVEKEGFSSSERTVGYSLDRIFYSAKGRIIVTSFASHVHRVQQVLWSAQRTERKVAVVGRGMQNMVTIAGSLGYLDIPQNILIDIDRINSLPADKVVVITTGSQGEPLSGLTRMASGEHRQVQIMPGDTVVISATPIGAFPITVCPSNRPSPVITKSAFFINDSNLVSSRIILTPDSKTAFV